MGALTQALESIIKKADDIYLVELDGIEIVFKLPSFKRALQYNLLLRIAKEDDLDYIAYDYIFKSICQDNFIANYEELPAGVPQSIVDAALFLSGIEDNGFSYTTELMDTYRQIVNSPHNFMIRIIASVFNYRFEELEELTYQRILYLFIQAETRLLESGIIEKEYKFITKSNDNTNKQMPISQQIQKDIEDYKKFESGESLDYKNMKLREELIRRAQQQEWDSNYHNSQTRLSELKAKSKGR